MLLALAESSAYRTFGFTKWDHGGQVLVELRNSCEAPYDLTGKPPGEPHNQNVILSDRCIQDLYIVIMSEAGELLRLLEETRPDWNDSCQNTNFDLPFPQIRTPCSTYWAIASLTPAQGSSWPWKCPDASEHHSDQIWSVEQDFQSPIEELVLTRRSTSSTGCGPCIRSCYSASYGCLRIGRVIISEWELNHGQNTFRRWPLFLWSFVLPEELRDSSADSAKKCPHLIQYWYLLTAIPHRFDNRSRSCCCAWYRRLCLAKYRLPNKAQTGRRRRRQWTLFVWDKARIS